MKIFGVECGPFHAELLVSSFMFNREKILYTRSMFNRGRIEDEFNSHRIGSGSEELMINMMTLDDIDMNL